MEYTRVDAKKLLAAVTKAVALVIQADEAVAEVLVLLTSNGRGSLPKPRDGFEAAAKKVALSPDLGDLKKISGYESDAVLEDLANVEIADRLTAPIAKLAQRVIDSNLLWVAEAYGMSMDLYKYAQVSAKTDAVIAKAIEPLAEHLSLPRFKKPAPTK